MAVPDRQQALIQAMSPAAAQQQSLAAKVYSHSLALCQAIFFQNRFVASANSAQRSDPPQWACVQASGTGAVIWLHVVPNARTTALVGLHGNSLRIRLAAVPVDGKANALLLSWLAVQLNVHRNALTLVSGEHARLKRVATQLPVKAVCTWLDGALGEQPDDLSRPQLG